MQISFISCGKYRIRLTEITINHNSEPGIMRYWGTESIPDNGNVNVNSSNAYFPKLGGNYNNDDNCGLFYANVNNNSRNYNTNYGSRLASTIKLQPHLEGKLEIKSPRPCHLAKHEVKNPHQYVGTLERAWEGAYLLMQVM